MAMGKAEERTRNLLIFRSSGLDCAFPLEAVREIVPMATLSSPPGLPSGLAGFLDLRGTAIPIIRLDRLFDLPEQQPGLHTPMIVLRGVLGPIGILVESVRGIVPAHSAQLLDIPEDRTFQGCATAVLETRRRSDSSAFTGRAAGGERRSFAGRLWRHGAGAPAPSGGNAAWRTSLIGVSQDPAYSRLKDHLIASTGLAFYADRDEQLAELIWPRLSDLGLRDCSSYAEFLADGEKGAAEMDVLIAQLTIGETYFFRDEAQFAAIRDMILPDILERKQASKRVTNLERRLRHRRRALLARDSAGCMQLAGRIAGWQIRIYATDLNRSYLAQAAEGKFRAWALRSTSEEVKRECFSKEGLIWTIHPRYKQWISFHHMNLVAERILHAIARGHLFRSDSVPQRDDLLRAGGESPLDRTISPISGGWRLAGGGRVRDAVWKATGPSVP